MIFNNNHTSLGSTIPMAEGYDCSFGAPLALIESAQNDYEMFKAMLNADYRELAMRESGYVNESEITSLNEAVGGGIFKKIAELFKKLAAKIKAIFHTFIGKMNGLFMKDKDLVKKYEKEVRRKSNIGNLEVKWRRKLGSDTIPSITSYIQKIDAENSKLDKLKNKWHEEKDDIYTDLVKDAGYSDCDWDDFEKDFEEKFLDAEETLQIKEINGGITGIMSFLRDYSKDFSKLQSAINKKTTALDKLANEADKRANALAKIDTGKSIGGLNSDGSVRTTEGESDRKTDEMQTDANRLYDVTICYQNVQLKIMSCSINCVKEYYKYNRAAFAKAITANDEKLKEATYLDAVAEAAADEVDAVIDDALKKEEISDLCAASTNVKDGDVCDDPEKLVYDKVQKYSDDADMDTAQGTKDTNINSNESAFFGQLLY